MTVPSIEQAIGHMQAAAWDDATRVLENVLAEVPDDPRALRLLGTVHYMNGRLDPARDLLEASALGDPRVVRTWLNLAAVHLAAGDHGRAVEAAERAVTLDDHSADAWFNLGVALQGAGRAREAERAYEQVLTLAPDSLDARMNLASLAALAGRLHSAAALAEEIVARDPQHLPAILCAARAHTVIGSMDRADALLRSAERLAPDSAAVAVERAEWLIVLGRLPEAESALRALVESNPEATSPWTKLGRVLIETGRHEEAQQHLAAAARLFPGSNEIALYRARALSTLGRRADALASVAEVVGRTPDSTGAHHLLGTLLLDTGRLAEADAAFQREVDLAPLSVHGHHGRVRVALARGAPEQALALSDAFLERQPSERTLLAAKAMVLRELGQEDAARSLLDLDGLISINPIDAPAGFAGVHAFNEALEAHVRAHPSLIESPLSHATRYGRHTGNLLAGDPGPFAAFERIVRAAFVQYMQRDVDHPYLRDPPGIERMVCWAVLMRRAGHQEAHIHPAAWMSGVYYVRVPQVVARGGGHEGWLEFGEPPEGLYHLTREQPRRLVRPAPGLLAMFPSFLYHRTVPYQSDEERLSIAFDILPSVAGFAT